MVSQGRRSIDKCAALMIAAGMRTAALLPDFFIFICMFSIPSKSRKPADGEWCHIERRRLVQDQLANQAPGCCCLGQTEMAMPECVKDIWRMLRPVDDRKTVGCRRAMAGPGNSGGAVQSGQVDRGELGQGFRSFEVGLGGEPAKFRRAADAQAAGQGRRHKIALCEDDLALQ